MKAETAASHRSSCNGGGRQNFHLVKSIGKWATESAGTKKQRPLCCVHQVRTFGRPFLLWPDLPTSSSADFHFHDMAFQFWMSKYLLPAPSLYPVFQTLSFNSWPISKNGSTVQRPSHLMSPCLDLPPWGLAPVGDTDISGDIWAANPCEIFTKSNQFNCSGRGLWQSIPDGASWQHQGAVIPVWLTEANSIGFWYETFQWHSQPSVRVILESSLYFPRWWREVDCRMYLKMQSELSQKRWRVSSQVK